MKRINKGAVMIKHETSQVYIKKAAVDIDILPVVTWLNSMHGTYTLWSCQGGGELRDEDVYCPYIRFVCMDVDEFEHIVSVVKSYYAYNPKCVSLKFSADLTAPRGVADYLELSFVNTGALKGFIKHIGGIMDSAPHVIDAIPEEDRVIV